MKNHHATLGTLVCALVVHAALNMAAVSLRADGLDNWTPCQIVTTPVGFMGSLLSGVAYGNGRFVAVGEYVSDANGVIQTSDDGVTWIKRTTQDYSILNLYDVAYGNGLFVAVGRDAYGGQNIYTSPNGTSWSHHFTIVSNVRSITYGYGLFVAGTDGALLLPSTGTTNQNIYTSADGLTWTARSSGSPAEDVRAITSVSYGANLYVGVDQSGHSYVSSTGVSGWQRYTNSLVADHVSFANGYFITPTGAGTNSISTDGINWIALTNDTGVRFKNVNYAAGTYVAFFENGIYSSLNITNWTARALPVGGNRHLQAGTFNNGRYVVVGYNYPPSPFVPMGYLSDKLVMPVVVYPGLPGIIASPTNSTVFLTGSNAFFSVTATNATSYQWRFNGVNIAGATSSVLVVTNAQPTNAGYYMVVAKNSVGWMPSQMAYLTVLGPEALNHGYVPFYNVGAEQAFYQDSGDYGNQPITNNATARIMVGPELDEMEVINSPRVVTNGYYGALSDTLGCNINPGKTAYYQVQISYPSRGGDVDQLSTVLSFPTPGGGIYPLPSLTKLHFPTWPEFPEPWVSYGGTAPPYQLRILGETFSLTNDYVGYKSFNVVPTLQWRKDGVTIGPPQDFVYLGASSYQYSSRPGFLTKTNCQPEDVGVYDMVVKGDNWFISPKVYVSILLTNGPGTLSVQGLAGSNIVFSLQGAPTRNYLVQCSTNLTAWSTLTTLSNATGIAMFTDSVAAEGRRFYRTVLVP